MRDLTSMLTLCRLRLDFNTGLLTKNSLKSQLIYLKSSDWNKMSEIQIKPHLNKTFDKRMKSKEAIEAFIFVISLIKIWIFREITHN